MRTLWAARLVPSAAIVGTSMLALSSCTDDTVGPSGPAVRPPENVIMAAASNTWATKKAMPTARFQVVAGTVNNIVYAIGGTNGTLTPFTTVQAYNPGTNSWTTKAPLPAGRRGLNGAATIGTRLFVAGGFNSAAALTRTLYVYDAPTNSWTKKADMPSAGGCGAEGVINNLLYVYVGCTSVPFGDKLFRYNPSTNTWTTLAAPPHQHAGGAAGVSMGKLYLAGGIDDGATVNAALDVFTPATNSWKTLASMPSLRAGMAGRVVGGKLYAVGGSDNGGNTVGAVQAYDVAGNTWSVKASMPTPRHDFGLAVANGLLFAVGGAADDGMGNQVILKTNQAFTP